MCGIAGMMARPGGEVSEAALDAMEKALLHRGPDGHGRHMEGPVGLVHTRLAIIDLETGDQPIRAATRDAKGDSGLTTLVANGEVYNYIELREGMPRQAFTTRSDCEPPLLLYLRHGADFAEHLRGMYAIAIHDPAKERLVLARDPFGIKPLYYAETDVGFAFASEPAALTAAGLVAPSLDPRRRDELLQLQFTTGAETAFQGIRRVLPGETLVIEKGTIVERRHRAALPPEGPRRGVSEERALIELDAQLMDTVGVHQRSDVPYGMFLSGGIDSSVLLAMMARLNERPVRAFTAAFPGTAAHDERGQARAVARAVGAEHVEVEFTEADFWALLPKVAAALDDPAADYAVLPTWKLAAAARGDGLKVVLSGEGGDELFAGYGRYRRAVRWRVFGGRPMRAKGIFDGLDVLRADGQAWREGVAATQRHADGNGRSKLQAAQAADVSDWLANDLLIKLDRCLMAHGVEGRVPFLDPKLADFAFRLPDRLKARKGLGKWLLRRWLETGRPEAQPFAAKRGFTVPVEEWIASRGAGLAPLMAKQPGIAEACHPDAVETLFRNLGTENGRKAGKAAWTLLFFALWHRRHMLGLETGNNVLDSLATTA